MRRAPVIFCGEKRTDLYRRRFHLYKLFRHTADIHITERNISLAIGPGQRYSAERLSVG